MRFLLTILIVAVSLFACRKEKPLPETANAGSGEVLVLNEGNFMWANASLDLYNLDSGILRSGIYEGVNQKPLGDVLQSGSFINGDVWLVVNNSGKIVVLDSQTLKEKYSITGLGSPRYAVKAGNNIWITDLYSGKIQIRDATGKQLIKQIHTGAWSEQMVVSGKNVWVACYDGWLRKYDAGTFVIIDSSYVGKGLRWIVSDKQNNIWALASFNDSGYSRLQQWSAVGNKMRSFTMPLSGYASSLCINSGKDTLYYLANGVYSLSVYGSQLPVKPIFTKPGANFYNIAHHPRRQLLFLCDAADYVSKGKVFVLDPSGNEKKVFTAGIIPSGFVFY
jgi:hypothetical protein